MGKKGPSTGHVLPELNERNIRKRLHRHLSNPRYVLDNLYVFGWESDVLVLTSGGYWYEYEVKISRADFKKDFADKGLKHEVLKDPTRTLKPNYLYYAVPEGLIKPEEVPDYAGLIYITPSWGCRAVKTALRLHKSKNRPEDMGLTDKFYYNMRSAKEAKEKLERRVEEMERPYMDGLRKGVEDALWNASFYYAEGCPHFEQGAWERRCRLKNRNCNRECEYIETFAENVRRLMGHTGCKLK